MHRNDHDISIIFPGIVADVVLTDDLKGLPSVLIPVLIPTLGDLQAWREIDESIVVALVPDVLGRRHPDSVARTRHGIDAIEAKSQVLKFRKSIAEQSYDPGKDLHFGPA